MLYIYIGSVRVAIVVAVTIAVNTDYSELSFSKFGKLPLLYPYFIAFVFVFVNFTYFICVKWVLRVSKYLSDINYFIASFFDLIMFNANCILKLKTFHSCAHILYFLRMLHSKMSL